MIRSAFPILATPDLDRALGFYRDLLGGRVTHRFPEDGAAVFVSMELGGSSQLGIGADPQAPSARCRSGSRCGCTPTRATRPWSGSAAPAWSWLEEPADQPWGERVARVADTDGNVVLIGSPPVSPRHGRVSRCCAARRRSRSS